MTDLQARLAQLISHASQLIFVACDSTADQQKSLKNFLSAQSEQVEISFFNAEKNSQEAEYRRTICRQFNIVHNESFARPLHHLISDSLGAQNQAAQSSHILCITQAECLSTKFLIELWTLVAQLKKQATRPRLNILLFAQNLWAEKMQNWLGQHQKDATVLISSQQRDVVGFDVNALESLMSERKDFFSDKKRRLIKVTKNKLIHRKRFASAALSLFALLFTTMLALQYPELLSDVFDSMDMTTENDMPLDELQLSNLQSESAAKNSTLSNIDAAIGANPPLDGKKEQDTNTKTPSATEQIADQEQSLTDTLLAGKWEAKPRSNDENNDFQVPDIISVEQLDRQLGGLNKQNNNDIKPSAKKSEKAISIADISDANEQDFDTIAIDQYRFDEELLLQLPNDQIVLQLSSIADSSVLNQFIASNNLKENTWIYRSERNGLKRFIVLHSDTFESTNSALAMVQSLPTSVQNAQPFTKTISQIRFEITGFN